MTHRPSRFNALAGRAGGGCARGFICPTLAMSDIAQSGTRDSSDDDSVSEPVPQECLLRPIGKSVKNEIVHFWNMLITWTLNWFSISLQIQQIVLVLTCKALNAWFLHNFWAAISKWNQPAQYLSKDLLCEITKFLTYHYTSPDVDTRCLVFQTFAKMELF